MNRIRQLRMRKGMTQAELGKVVNKSLHAVSKWETGRNQPSQEDLVKLSRFFGVSIEYLMGVTDILSTRGKEFVDTSKERYGNLGMKEAQELLYDIQSLFSGGELPEEDRDEFFRVITEMYWEAKEAEKNRTQQ